MNRRAVCFLFLAFVASCRDGEPEASAEGATAALANPQDECTEAAAKRVEEWRLAGLDAAEVERRKGLAAASCAGSDVDSATAVFMGRINVDYARMASAFVARRLTPAEYNQALKSRREKLRRVHADPTWTAEWIKGDADGDLVPDSRDRCPNTADLAPTDEIGCPLPAPPQRGRPALVDQMFEKMGVLRADACDGAPPPDVPSPVAMTVPNVGPRNAPEKGDLVITITPVTNQPAACPVFYELSTDSTGFRLSAPAPGRTFHAYGHAVFRLQENKSTRADRLEFLIHSSDGARRAQIRQRFLDTSATHWRVRAVNGNGLASPWSMPLESD